MTQPRPDRVVIINDRSADVGGASNLSRLSARLLRERGIPVTFFAGDRADAAASETDAVNLNGAPLLEQGRLSAFVGGLYNASAFAALRRLIDTSDTPATIYHVHGWSKILSPAIFRALNTVRERVVLHAHDYFLACPNGGFVNYRKASVCSLTPMSARCLLTQCDKRGAHQKLWRSARHALRQSLYDVRRQPANIVLVHGEMQRYFERAGLADRRFVTIRNPVEPFLQTRAEPWKSQDFFFIARLEPEKGFEDAAKAARIAGVRLHVVGDGAGRALLERSYPEVVLHGWKKREEIAQLVRKARAVVVSSRVPEPFGLAALEAIGSGIPVIVPSQALVCREIVEADCGLGFTTGDVNSLADTMRAMARDDLGVRRMGRNGFQEAPRMANTLHSWGEALMELYADVLEHARPPLETATPGRGNTIARVYPRS
ncbi:glycosyltransferase family 4 protein [Chelativorans salis]|uniref:Glycosyltransferase family 4 protein n=1 Tax=Chelativorans salis TaxID=2978478 RepID=A0ABT2LLX2_9HYPH|nr:glycosyltransferase family 4 protein [Chelativorans sp. EGI FJ00035]MCT7375580.1 glycosyltransferase family 4 protein [Chelativorans sp. EGI FJ00035]